MTTSVLGSVTLGFEPIWDQKRQCAGVRLFVVYVGFYGGFMALSAFWPDVMSQPFFLGVNLAVVYGFSLIAAALVLALVYMATCRKS